MMKGLLLIVCWTVGAWSREMILITDVTIECQLRDNFEVSISVYEEHEGRRHSRIGKKETFHVANKDIVLGLSGYVRTAARHMDIVYMVKHTCVSSPDRYSGLIVLKRARHSRVDYSPSTVTLSQGTWLLNGKQIIQKENGETIGERFGK